jgi:hypothetical protein
MAPGKRTTFLGLLLSVPVLTPIVLGVGGAVLLGMTANKNLAAFVAICGILGGVGTLLTLWMLNAKRLDPAIARRRQQLLAVLEELVDGRGLPVCAEAGAPATAAAGERL